jgi:hypothetical protein
MERLVFIPLVYILTQWHLAMAQSGVEVLPRGARSLGLANASVALADAWGFFNNIGSLCRVDQSEFFAGYDHRLGLNELTTLAAGAVFKHPSGAFGVGLSNFGGDLFNQQTLGFGYANQLGLASLGAKIGYLQTNIEGLGRGLAPIVELGGVAELAPWLLFGTRMYNLTRSKLSQITGEYLPMIISSGLSFKPSESLMINLEAEKEVYLAPQMKMGVEYGIQDKLWARTGINTRPQQLFFGIGFSPKKYRFDYAMSQNYRLGFTHHFSINYLWNEQ